jgi:hypothetical protein
MKEKRAEEIALQLSDNERWHSHGIGINMQTLKRDLNLKIEDLMATPEVHKTIRQYFDLMQDYMSREKISYFVHTKESF